MEELQRRLSGLGQRWREISGRARVAILAAVAAAVAGGVLYYAATVETPDTVLFSGLTQEDAARVVERLRDQHVPHELSEGGATILVPEGRVHEIRLSLASEGLPNGGTVGFEVFDEQRFGESEFAEQIKYQRALEGELARTIAHLAGVEAARVHLVLPERSLFREEDDRASASVVLRLRPGWQMDEDRVRGVVHLVASSVRGLSPENVTVVDGNGRHLSFPEDPDKQGMDDAVEFRRRIEASRERAVQELLDATLGPGHGMVRVAAEVSFTREERTEERYEPDAVAPRSFQIEEELDGEAAPVAAGVPGTPSNLPGGESPSVETRSGRLVRRVETRNFEVSKVVRRAVEPVGRVERLHVAVVVDGTWTGEGESRTFEPRSDDELRRIEALVAGAAGVDTERGDRITVECVPFAEVDAVGTAWEAAQDPLAPYRPYVPYAAALAVLPIVLFGWVLARRRAAAVVPPEVTARSLGSGIAGKLPEVAGAGSRDEAADEEARLLAAQLAEQSPEMAARVVRGWLEESAS